MSQTLKPENLVRILAALLLALLCWTGKCLCDRVSALEATQNRICVCLGIEPVAAYPKGSTPEVVAQKAYSKSGRPKVVDAAGKNRQKQKSDGPIRIPVVFPLPWHRAIAYDVPQS